MVFDEVWSGVRYQKEPLKDGNTWGRLINLRHVIGKEVQLKNIANMGRLTSLQKLEFSVGKNNGFKICELSDMRDLRSLRIDQIENVDSCEEVKQANLIGKINFNELILKWNSSPESNEARHLHEAVLNHLEPHHGLKELEIIYYEGNGSPPTWFTTQTLSKLVSLTIFGCTFENLPCLEELPLLKYIDFCRMDELKVIIHKCNLSSAIDAFPSLQELSVECMEELKEWCLAKQPNKWMQCLRKLRVNYCRELQVLSPVPVGVKELSFEKLGLKTLPNLWNDQSSKSGSLADLVDMSISYCKNIVSLNEGLLQNPERFVNLERLEIYECTELMNLPPRGFNKFISLKELKISLCEKIVVQEECFLPSALQSLEISSCGHLDTIFSKALENVHSLIELELYYCENITSLPPKELFSRWKTLKKLSIGYCPVLASLESLLGLSSIEFLQVYGCPELSRAIASPLPLEKDETERKEDGTTQTSDRKEGGRRMALRKERKEDCSVSSQPQLPSPSTQEKPLLSMG